MKWIVSGILVVSLVMIFLLVFKKRLGFGWLSVFGAHLALSAVALYVLNFTGLVPEVYIPLNPMTIGTVAVLGVPGVLLLVGLKLTLL